MPGQLGVQVQGLAAPVSVARVCVLGRTLLERTGAAPAVCQGGAMFLDPMKADLWCVLERCCGRLDVALLGSGLPVLVEEALLMSCLLLLRRSLMLCVSMKMCAR